MSWTSTFVEALCIFGKWRQPNRRAEPRDGNRTGTIEGWKKTFCRIAEVLKPVYERDAHPPAGK